MISMNEILRRQVNEFIKENGVIAKHIAKKINISPAMLCYFRHGKKGLGSENAKKLQEFLAKYSMRGCDGI
jgi:DNA transposition AAA+ family ATPase